jgi:Calx-beta domain-containing protein
VRALVSTCALAAFVAAVPATAQADLQAGCPAAEYVYAGARMLAVVKPSDLPQVGFSVASSPVGEATATGDVPVEVRVTTVPAACAIGTTIVLNYATVAGTARRIDDFTPVSGSLTFPATAVGGTSQTIRVPIVNDVNDEPDETFNVVLSDLTPQGPVLLGLATHTVTITDNDPPPTVSIGDASITEVDGFSVVMTFPVTLSAYSGYPITVDYATVPGSATPGADYAAVAGTITIPAGPPQNGGPIIQVAIFGDDLHEDTENFFVNLTVPLGSPVTPGDLQAQGTITDDDLQKPIVSISSAQFPEGDEGTNMRSLTVGVTESGQTVTVSYATAPHTATSPADYQTTSGTITFDPGETIHNIPLAIVADGQPEPDEAFYVNLSGLSSNAEYGVSQGTMTIFNDDASFVPSVELPPGSDHTANLAAVPGLPNPTPAVHLYRLGQKPRSSYEVIVDSTSADLDNGFGIQLGRYAFDQTTLLQGSATSPHVVSRRLRWTNAEFVAINQQFIKVQSSNCTTNCGVDDVYRIRTYDTTYSIPRFNNTGGQATVLLLQNTSPNLITGSIDFWADDGSYLGSTGLGASAHNTFVLDTSGVMPGASGSITITNTGAYADLVGKAVAIVPASGLSYDTAMSPRPLR